MTDRGSETGSGDRSGDRSIMDGTIRSMCANPGEESDAGTGRPVRAGVRFPATPVAIPEIAPQRLFPHGAIFTL